MKKRTVITIIITVIAIIAARKYWFFTEPLPVSFDISGHGSCNIEVQLNKKDNFEFKKIKSASEYINLDGKKHIDMLVKKSKHPKKIKIILSCFSSDKPITIGNLQLKNGEFSIYNIDKFKVYGANTVIKDNKLILTPNSDMITLIYPETLQVNAKANFDFMLFAIILILVYLLAYKLSDYAAEFNTFKGKSRIEIIFLTIFFVFLLIPVIHINKNDISVQENRTLAKWKPLTDENNRINFEFGNDFNKWFNDRFNLRQSFVNFHSSFTMLITNKCEKGVFDNTTKTIYPEKSFEHTDINVIKDNFKALYDFNNWCDEHNIKLYILIVPKKADIHTTDLDYINDNYKHNAFLDYIAKINKENKIKVIYPYTSMINAVKEGKQLYFKTEHHWTDDGAFIGYRELMKEIKKDYPNIRVLNHDDFDYSYNKMVRGDFSRYFGYGQDCHRIGISDLVCGKYHHYDYKYYRHKDFDNLKAITVNVKYHLGKIFRYDYGADYRVIQLGTSMNENLTEFIPFTFKDVKRIRNNSVKDVEEKDEFKIMKYYEKEMLDYKPDIIIFCITYSNIADLHNLFNRE